MNILLVDDEPLELEQLEIIIQSSFPLIQCFKALDGIQALSIAKDLELNLALLDINLPGKSGLELAKELKLLNSQLDIIIVTAHQDFNFAKRSIELGVLGYITKPIIEEELTEVIETYKNGAHYFSNSSIVNEAIRIIKKDYTEKLSLVDVAKKIHVNATYLSRCFNNEVGTSFSQFLLNYRLKKAKEYLAKYPDWSILTIAEKTGFNSQQYFSTTFRKYTGKSPKSFQRKMRS